MSAIDFDDLIGGEFDFYGVDGYRFQLDDMAYEYVEGDESYEVIRSDTSISGLPLARVEVSEVDTGYALVDLHDRHEWLRFGEVMGSYIIYPFFDYTPKAL